MIFDIFIAPTALNMLAGISDRRARVKIRERIDALARDPEKQGKPLTGEFLGYRAVRTLGQRYRIVYRVSSAERKVWVAAVGIRKRGSKTDIYELAQRLLRLGLIETPAKKPTPQKKKSKRGKRGRG